MPTLRPATEADWARLLAWRNDPDARAAFVSTEIVTVPEHRKWLTKTLADRNKLLLVAIDRAIGFAVGTARLDRVKDVAECSVTVDGRYRGRGYATFIVSQLASYVPPDWRCARLVARIKQENTASLRTFTDAGFVYATTDKSGLVVLELALGDFADVAD